MKSSKSSEISKYMELFQQKYNNLLNINSALQIEKQECIRKKDIIWNDRNTTVKKYNDQVNNFRGITTLNKPTQKGGINVPNKSIIMQGGQPQQYQKYIPIITTLLINKMINDYNSLKNDNQIIKNDIDKINSEIVMIQNVINIFEIAIQKVIDAIDELKKHNDESSSSSESEIKSNDDTGTESGESTKNEPEETIYIQPHFNFISTDMLSGDIYTFIESLKQMDTFKDQIKNLDMSKEYIKNVPKNIYETSEVMGSKSSDDWVNKFIDVSNKLIGPPDKNILMLSLIGLAGVSSYDKTDQSKNILIKSSKHEKIISTHSKLPFIDQSKKILIKSSEHEKIIATHSKLPFIDDTKKEQIIVEITKKINKAAGNGTIGNVILNILPDCEKQLGSLIIIDDSNVIDFAIESIYYVYVSAMRLFTVDIQGDVTIYVKFSTIVSQLYKLVNNINYDKSGDIFNASYSVLNKYIVEKVDIFKITDVANIIANIYYNIYLLNKIKQRTKIGKKHIDIHGNYNINFFVQIISYITKYCINTHDYKNKDVIIPVNELLDILSQISQFFLRKIDYDKMRDILEDASKKMINMKYGNHYDNQKMLNENLLYSITNNVKNINEYISKKKYLDPECDVVIKKCPNDTNKEDCSSISTFYNSFLNALANSYLYNYNYDMVNVDIAHELGELGVWFYQKKILYAIKRAFNIENILKNDNTLDLYNAITDYVGPLYGMINYTSANLYSIDNEELPLLNDIFAIIGDPSDTTINQYINYYYKYKLSFRRLSLDVGDSHLKALRKLVINESDDKKMEKNLVWNDFKGKYNSLIKIVQQQYDNYYQIGGNNVENIVLGLWNDIITKKITLNDVGSTTVLDKVKKFHLPSNTIISLKNNSNDIVNISESKIKKLIRLQSSDKKDFVKRIKYIKESFPDEIKEEIHLIFAEKTGPSAVSNDKLDSQWIAKFCNIIDNNLNGDQPPLFYIMMTMIGLISLKSFVQNYNAHIKSVSTMTTTSITNPIIEQNVNNEYINKLWIDVITKEAGEITEDDLNSLTDCITRSINLSPNIIYYGVEIHKEGNIIKEESILEQKELRDLVNANYKSNGNALEVLSNYVDFFKRKKDGIIQHYKELSTHKGGSRNYEHKYKKYKLKYINLSLKKHMPSDVKR